ncbi:MAG: thioredoxin reductase [Clostridia bacterium]|jgi:thioredoxin reductase (NADPH)|nr:thioredoxin reductase [Clostridia bacterium]
MQNLLEKKANSLLSATMREQLKIILSKLDREVTLATIVDNEDPKSIELKDFVLDVASLNEFITTEIYDRYKNPDAETSLHADKFPVLALLDSEKYYSGVKYHGIPLEHALGAFALTLYNIGGPGTSLDLIMAEKIMDVRTPANIKVCISLSCPHCADAVVAAQRLALLNPRVQAEMIDIDLFPDIKEQYDISSVPALIINDKSIHFNVKTLDDMINLLTP